MKIAAVATVAKLCWIKVIMYVKNVYQKHWALCRYRFLDSNETQ
jgi:hypothetical protein